MPDGPGLPWEPPSTYAMRSDNSVLPSFLSKTHNEAHRVAPSRDSFGSRARLGKSRFGFGFVESSVENVETNSSSRLQPHFIATLRILAVAKKNCDCTNHGR